LVDNNIPSSLDVLARTALSLPRADLKPESRKLGIGGQHLGLFALLAYSGSYQENKRIRRRPLVATLAAIASWPSRARDPQKLMPEIGDGDSCVAEKSYAEAVMNIARRSR
jgi:hypothetical protein